MTSSQKRKTFICTLVRHGETNANREHVIQGQSDTPLSTRGEEQARLAAHSLQDIQFTYMVSSDLQRAANTAKEIASMNRATTCTLNTDARLRERCFGILEGHPFAEFQRIVKTQKLNPATYTPEGGESVDQVASRAKMFFKTLCDNIMKGQASEIDPDSTIRSEDLEAANGESLDVIKGSSVSELITDLSMVKEENSTHTQHASASSLLSDDMASVCSSNLQADISASPGSSTVLLTAASTDYTKLSLPDPIPYYSSSDSTGDVTTTKKKRKKKDPDHCLIVSHGLMLRELKKIILSFFLGELGEDDANKVNMISPNTAISRFTLTTELVNGKQRIRCTKVHFIDSTTHLQLSKENLVSHAKFQGLL